MEKRDGPVSFVRTMERFVCRTVGTTLFIRIHREVVVRIAATETAIRFYEDQFPSVQVPATDRQYHPSALSY